jgi:hypothetical protein
MSFADLYRLAWGVDWSAEEKSDFEQLDHEGRNRWVLDQSSRCPTLTTAIRVGSDSLDYVGFWVTPSER